MMDTAIYSHGNIISVCKSFHVIVPGILLLGYMKVQATTSKQSSKFLRLYFVYLPLSENLVQCICTWILFLACFKIFEVERSSTRWMTVEADCKNQENYGVGAYMSLLLLEYALKQ